MAKKTQAQYREEIRKMFSEKLMSAPCMEGALLFDPDSPKWGIPVEHPELGTVYVSLQLVVKGWTKTETRDPFDLEEEHEIYLQEMEIKEKEAKAAKEKKEREAAERKAKLAAKKSKKSKKEDGEE